MANRYQKILVAVDLSDEADDVIAAAQYQAQVNSGAELHMVNVVRPVAHTHGGLDAGALASMADLDGTLIARADKTVSELASKHGITNKHTRTGHPATEIKAMAESLGVDLIVIGTHGRHGLGLLLGSTANAVLHGVSCDVLTVRIHN